MVYSTGNLCIVLHGHLPYVLHHGAYPHGEAWLYEAAAETYLPLLDLLGKVTPNQGHPALTIGLTPVLLEQLAHPHFKDGFANYLQQRMDQAESDRKEFAGKGDATLASLARRWIQWHQEKLEQFEKIGRDIPRQFADRGREGRVQLLTSNATHAYLPLLRTDEAIAAQLSAGLHVSEKHLGIKPHGMWLPECAYRPHCRQWTGPVLSDAPQDRPGLEHFIAEAGIDHFFVESHSVQRGECLGIMVEGKFQAVVPEQLHWQPRGGWKSVMEAVGVASEAGPARCFAMARHPQLSEQVWSSIGGYPGAGEYLDFHLKHGGGLRYHRITHQQTPAEQKQPYDPSAVASRVIEQARHFCDTVRRVLQDYHELTGRPGTALATYDAELFGHWWHEGPEFLRQVLQNLSADPSIRLVTARQCMEENPPQKVMRLPEGSWGEKGDHSVWVNEQTRWMWEVEYRAERRMVRLLRELPWRRKKSVKMMLQRAGRELFLLQASDWPFVVHSRGAVDYGHERFGLHATRFNRATEMAECLSAGLQITPIQQTEIDEMDSHDVIFPEIDLEWWG